MIYVKTLNGSVRRISFEQISYICNVYVSNVETVFLE